jgi:hypothetical protein
VPEGTTIGGANAAIGPVSSAGKGCLSNDATTLITMIAATVAMSPKLAAALFNNTPSPLWHGSRIAPQRRQGTLAVKPTSQPSTVGKDTVCRTWRKVKGDWDGWNVRSLADEPIVRLILDGTVVGVRLDRKSTAISLLVVLGVRANGQKMLLVIKSMGSDTVPLTTFAPAPTQQTARMWAAGRSHERRDRCLPIVLASAKSPYSDTIAAIPGKTARSAKKATPPDVDSIRSSEIDQNTRQKISLQPRGGICPGAFASRPRPVSRARARSTELPESLLAPTSARHDRNCSDRSA